VKCPSCSRSNEDDALFCTNCGAKLVSEGQQPTTVRTAKSPFTGKEFIIDQKIAAVRDTFAVKDRNDKLLAYVKKKVVSWGPQFYFETLDGARFGEMRGKVLTVRPTFEIYDNQGLVAIVKKKIVKLLGSEWWLQNSSGREIARIKGNITGHEFAIRSPSGTSMALIHKKWVSIRDSYGIEIQIEEIDPYIIIAYAIAMDHAQFKTAKKFGVGFGGQ